MIKKYLLTGGSYLAGALSWFVLLIVLQANCIANVTNYIDGLWTKEINDDLIENIMGSVAYKTGGFDCEDNYIYVARYYAGNGVSGEFEIKPLTVFVDSASWKYIEADTTTTTYEDNRYRYILYKFSDEISMRVFDK